MTIESVTLGNWLLGTVIYVMALYVSGLIVEPKTHGKLGVAIIVCTWILVSNLLLGL